MQVVNGKCKRRLDFAIASDAVSPPILVVRYRISHYRFIDFNLKPICHESESEMIRNPNPQPNFVVGRRKYIASLSLQLWEPRTGTRHCGLPIMYERTKRVCKCIQLTALPSDVHSSYIQFSLFFKIGIKFRKIAIFSQKQLTGPGRQLVHPYQKILT